MPAFLKTGETFVALDGDPVLIATDGSGRQVRASVALAPAWSDAEREAFGVFVVDVEPPAGQRWTGDVEDNGEGVPVAVFSAIIITVADVVAERARRLEVGFDYDFGDSRGVHRIGQTAADLAGWSEVTTAAQAAINLGDATPIGIVTDTGPVEVTPLEWQAILAAATAYRQPIWAASFVLQAMQPIPADFADDIYWP
jgi:hypothetical protein